MFQREIGTSDLAEVVRAGEVIAEYPHDRPYPSYLLLGYVGGRVLHVVVALDTASGRCHTITVYEPDPGLWNDDFRSRRPR